MTTATRTVYFSVTGEWITNFFRDKVLEGDWQRAINELRDTISCTLEQSMSILCGDNKLVGVDSHDDPGIDLVKDGECSDYLETLRYQYGHLVRIDNKWMKPYAYVTNYGIKDVSHIDWDRRLPEVIPEFMHNDKKLDLIALAHRAKSYCNNRYSDEVITTKINSEKCGQKVRMAVLFERTDAPPLWTMLASTGEGRQATIQRAVDIAADQQHLDRVGHIQEQIEEAGSEREAMRVRCMNYADEEAENYRLGAAYSFHNIDETLVTVDGPLPPIPGQRPPGALKVPTPDELFKSHRKADAALDDLEGTRRQILEQNEKLADGRMIEHDFGGKVGKVRIPEYPLRAWSLRRTHLRVLIEDWKTICPMGMKASVDDPYHSDWMVGAGIDLGAYGDTDFSAQMYDLMHEIQEEEMGFKFTILVNGKGKAGAVGTIVHPKPNEEVASDEIAVVPNAGEAYYAAARTAAAVIVENGGAMSHLAVVGLEEGFLIIRDEGARKKYRPGTLLTIDTKKGNIEVMAFDKMHWFKRKAT